MEYDDILYNIKECLDESSENNSKAIDIFIENMGYLKGNLEYNPNKDKVVIDKKLLLEVIPFDKLDPSTIKDLSGIEWAIIMGEKTIWLLYNGGNSLSKNRGFNPVVLSVPYNQKLCDYLRYFSYENILGQHPNTYYFKDILEYKNNFYKGAEKSWAKYYCTLKRFLNYQISKGMEYDLNINRKDNYAFIQVQDFYDYIYYSTKTQTSNTIKTTFYYLKDFMNNMTNNTIFDCRSEDILTWFPGILSPTDVVQNIMDVEKLRKAVEYLQEGRYGERDAALFNVLVQFGWERRKLCNIKWDDISLNNGQNPTISMNGLNFIIPKTLAHRLYKLKEKNPNTKYVFCRNYKDDIPIQKGTINFILSKLVKIDPEDPYYRYLTPENIRKSLIKFYLNNGHYLDDIAFYMDLEFYNLDNYISREELVKSVEQRKRRVEDFSLYKVDILC